MNIFTRFTNWLLDIHICPKCGKSSVVKSLYPDDEGNWYRCVCKGCEWAGNFDDDIEQGLPAVA